MPKPRSHIRELPHPGKLAAIDYGVQTLGVRSFADLGGIGRTYGQYAFYALDRPGVSAGVLVDENPGLNDDWVVAQAQGFGLRRIFANFADSSVAADVGHIDAVFLFDVLLHQVDPDWDEVIELWAPNTDCFVVANPQWNGASTVRLIELGRKRYLKAVPKSKLHAALFDRLDELNPRLERPWRDTYMVWQWGITDSDLTARMEDAGFSLRRTEAWGPFPGATGFTHKSFVFSRVRAPRHR